MARTN